MMSTRFEPGFVGPTSSRLLPPAGAELKQFPAHTTETGGVDGIDTEAHLAGCRDFLSDLEQGSAAGDRDFGVVVQRVRRLLEGKGCVERVGLDGGLEAFAQRGLPVDPGLDVGPADPVGSGTTNRADCGRQRALQGLDANELSRTEVRTPEDEEGIRGTGRDTHRGDRPTVCGRDRTSTGPFDRCADEVARDRTTGEQSLDVTRG